MLPFARLKIPVGQAREKYEQENIRNNECNRSRKNRNKWNVY